MYIVWVVVPIFLALDSAKLHNDLVRNGMVSHTQTRDVSSIVINMRCMYVKCENLYLSRVLGICKNSLLLMDIDQIPLQLCQNNCDLVNIVSKFD